MRALALSFLLFSTAGAHAAGVSVELEGLNEEMSEATRSSLRLADYGKRDISPAELRASFKNADEQIRKALEPFGFYDVEIDKKLTGDANNGWKARFVVTPGKPAIVREEKVEVRGEGKQQRRVAEAVAGFAPKVGDRLDHATYEASKQVIDSSLRGSGFLDAKYAQRRVTVKPEEESADISLIWDSGPRYKFGPRALLGRRAVPRTNSCSSSSPGAKTPSSTPSRCSTCSSAWWMRTTSSWCRCSRRWTRRKTAPCPSTCCSIVMNAPCTPARCTTARTSVPACAWAPSAAGSTRRATRRMCSSSTRSACRKFSTHYQIPRPGREDRSYDFGAAYRDETTDTSRSRNFQLAATRSEKRWHGFTRTLGVKYFKGDFEIGQDEDNLEFGESQLLFAEGTLTRRRVNDRIAPRRGYVLEFGVRAASEAIVSDTDIAQAWGRLTWLLPQGERGRFKFRAEAGAMAVGNFDALPPDIRFYAGGDRSIRGFDYQAIGETSAAGNIIGGKYLALGSVEYEYYFNDSWGAAVFSDAGDAFTDEFNLNASVGVGLRWRSPLGPIRVDLAVPVETQLEKSWRVHVLLGPDI